MDYLEHANLVYFIRSVRWWNACLGGMALLEKNVVLLENCVLLCRWAFRTFS